MAISAEDVFSRTMTPAQREEAGRRGAKLIEEYHTLQQLRRARELTQTELGEMLGKDQVSISQLEKRTDMLLSTLRSYVEAMGGTLNLVVQFDGRAPVILSGLAEDGAKLPRKRKPNSDAATQPKGKASMAV
jgi:transcriptional regulator with XRE-family HTH domain